MLVLPRPRVREFLQQPGTSRIVVTDCGYFPRAESHGRERRLPIGQGVVIVCTEGKGWCTTPTGTYPVAAGDTVILPPGHPHSYGADSDEPWTLWWMHAAGPGLAEFLDAFEMTIRNPVRRSSNPFEVVALMSEIIRRMERDSTTLSMLVAAGTAWHVLSLLAADTASPDGTDELIDQAAEYVRLHVDEPISVAELASMARISVSHFGALFKKRVGAPVLQYHTQLRMARARELLDTTHRSITTIASEVGYPDSFYFARQFKKIHGVTPRDYRAQHKG